MEATPDLGSGLARGAGSTPAGGIMSNIKYYNRPLDTAIIRLQDILDRMLDQKRFRGPHIKIVWHELDTIKDILVEEQEVRQEEETIGLAVIEGPVAKE